jgi:hypothetical protein
MVPCVTEYIMRAALCEGFIISYYELYTGFKTGAYDWQTYRLLVPIVLKSGSLILLEYSGFIQAITGIPLSSPLRLTFSRCLRTNRMGLFVKKHVLCILNKGNIIRTIIFSDNPMLPCCVKIWPFEKCVSIATFYPLSRSFGNYVNAFNRREKCRHYRIILGWNTELTSRSRALENLLVVELIRKLSACLWSTVQDVAHNNPPQVSTMRQIKPIHILTRCFWYALMQSFYLLLRHSSRLLLAGSSAKYFFAILIFCMSHSRWSPWYYFQNSIWWQANILNRYYANFSIICNVTIAEIWRK